MRNSSEHAQLSTNVGMMSEISESRSSITTSMSFIELGTFILPRKHHQHLSQLAPTPPFSSKKVVSIPRPSFALPHKTENNLAGPLKKKDTKGAAISYEGDTIIIGDTLNEVEDMESS
ncbi:hypothetical protein NHQ30_000598 [Ciborinia camelliae]|nr:hypothetical protein NHQ30_000598 [Ciborinia camelliae]